MPAYRRIFRCEVLTPTGPVCAADAVSCVLPAWDGLMGVLGGHAPTVALLGSGRMRVEPAEGEPREFFLDGGFAYVQPTGLTVIAEECVPAEQIDREVAWDEIQQARRMPVETDEEVAARDRALDRARERFRLAQRHRRRMVRA